jgi:O-acetylserine/cysteine efflux transporter
MTPERRALGPPEIAAIAAINIIWAINVFAIEIPAEALPPVFAAALRFSIALICLWPFLPIPRAQVRPMLIVAALSGPLHFGLIYVAYAMADDVTPLIVAIQLWVPISALLATVMLGERASLIRWAGLIVGVAGIAVMGLDGAVAADWAAIGIGLIACSCWALTAVLTRKYGGLPAVRMQAWTALTAAPALFALSALTETGQIAAAQAAAWPVWAGLAFAALVSSLAANGLMFALVQKVEVNRVTPWLLLYTVLAAAISALGFGEHLTWPVILGGAVTLAGVALVAVAERRSR